MTDAPAFTLKDIAKFFDYSGLSDFAKDWKQLDDRSKEQIKSGIKDGTFDYAV